MLLLEGTSVVPKMSSTNSHSFTVRMCTHRGHLIAPSMLFLWLVVLFLACQVQIAKSVEPESCDESDYEKQKRSQLRPRFAIIRGESDDDNEYGSYYIPKGKPKGKGEGKGKGKGGNDDDDNSFSTSLSSFESSASTRRKLSHFSSSSWSSSYFSSSSSQSSFSLATCDGAFSPFLAAGELSNTDYARSLINSAQLCIELCAGEAVAFESDPTSSSGDTYLRLYLGDITDQVEVAFNDDSGTKDCSLLSKLTYVQDPSVSENCNTYCLSVGCFSGFTCSQNINVYTYDPLDNCNPPFTPCIYQFLAPLAPEITNDDDQEEEGGKSKPKAKAKGGYPKEGPELSYDYKPNPKGGKPKAKGKGESDGDNEYGSYYIPKVKPKGKPKGKGKSDDDNEYGSYYNAR